MRSPPFSRADVHDYRLNDVRGKGTPRPDRRGDRNGTHRQRGHRPAAGVRLPHARLRQSAHGLRRARPARRAARQSDIVTLHTPLTAETHHLLDRRRIGQMKHGAVVVNTGRGALARHRGPRRSLGKRPLGGAALDVLEGEEGIFYADRQDTAHRERAAAAAAGAAERADQPAHRLLHRPCPGDTVEHTLTNCLSSQARRVGMDRLKVGILFGGCSEEHPISVKSAQEVAEHLDTEKYEPFYVGITKDGAWKLCDGPTRTGKRHLPAGRPVTGPERPRTARPGAGTLRDDPPRRGVARPARQARRGRRDAGPAGALRHPLRRLRHPELRPVHGQVPDVHGRQSAGIATPNFWIVTANENVDPDELTYPVFVKPARSGSSFGVSKVSGKKSCASCGGGRTTVRLEGADRRGRRRQRGRLRHPGRTIRTCSPARSIGSPSLTASSGSIRRTSRRAAPRTRPSSFPRTSRRSPARSSRRRRRPSIAPWDAGDSRGWTCSSRTTERWSSTRSTRCPA